MYLIHSSCIYTCNDIAIACNCTQKCTALHKCLDAVPNSFAFVMKRWGSSRIHMSQCAYLCLLQPHTNGVQYKPTVLCTLTVSYLFSKFP